MKIHDNSSACLPRWQAAVAVVLMLFAAGSGPCALAQNRGREITGTVVDENNQPFEGVTIMVEGTTNGTMTDSEGSFTLGNVRDNAVLLVSCIGYKTQRVESGVRSSFSFKLVPDAESLEEVVLVAFGSQKKATVTGSIATVAPAELRKTTTTRLDNALAGRVTGLTSMQSGGGQPGVDGATLYLRGAATPNGKSPLILVDGIERDNIRTIDMNEVESISILKDASATAMYGVQGANGVILISTRHGEKGKTDLSITFDQSWTSFTKEPERLHSWEYCELRNQASINDGASPAYSDAVIEKYRNPLFGLDKSDPDYATRKKMREYMYCDNDYYRMYLKKYTPQQRLNANVSGGTDFVKYFLNFGYIHQGGNLNTEDPDMLGYDPSCFMNRFSLRSNLDFQLTKSLSASLNIASYAENVNMPCVGGMYGGNPANDSNQTWMITDLIYQSQTILPISPGPTTISEFGVDDGYLLTYSYLDRTAYEIMNRRGFHTNKRKNLNTQLSVTWDLSDLVTPGLSLNGMAAYDTYNRGILEGYKQERIYTASVDYDKDELVYSISTDSPSELSLFTWRASNYTVNAQASIDYARIFGRHNVTGKIVGMRKYWEATGAGIPFNVLGLAARFTYSFADKYLAEVNLGYNGSEQFAPSKRFGFFPAFSAGWVASNEGFLKDHAVVTWLKFRTSWGKVGNDQMGNLRFLFQDNIQTGGGTNSGGLGGRTISEGLLGNRNITWEVATKWNLGVELGLFKDFRVTFDYFTEDRDQILISRQTIPDFQGIPSGNIPKVNMGVVKNHGFEVELGYNRQLTKDWSVSLKGNLGFNDNKFVEYDEPKRTEDYVCRYRTEGYRIGQAFGYAIDWNSPGKGYYLSREEIENGPKVSFGSPRVGDFVYIDQNKDGVIDPKDEVPIGFSTSVPGINYGATFATSFKNFDFSILFQGLARYSNYYSGQGVVEYTKSGTFFGWHRNAWTKERWENGEEITYPALSTAQTTSHRRNDFFIQNRSFLRLKNVELGYTLSAKALGKAGVKSIRLYVSGQNLFVWDGLRIKHIDPEQNNSFGYPITGNVSAGFNVNF